MQHESGPPGPPITKWDCKGEPEGGHESPEAAAAFRVYMAATTQQRLHRKHWYRNTSYWARRIEAQRRWIHELPWPPGGV